LIECALRGGVKKLYGTDLRPEALLAAKTNIAAAGVDSSLADLVSGDFRNFLQYSGLRPCSLSLMITNPPLGMRIPIPDLRALMTDLISTAAKALKPGGRLVFVNPIKSPALSHPGFRRTFHHMVDMSGFDCALEKYVKL
ncbi:MAG: methyltransferase, partial [Terrimicrobiaceae bacterium]